MRHLLSLTLAFLVIAELLMPNLNAQDGKSKDALTKQTADGNASLKELKAGLAKAIAAGELTPAQAAIKYEAAAAKMLMPSKQVLQIEQIDLANFTMKLKVLVAKGKLTEEEAWDLYQSVSSVGSTESKTPKQPRVNDAKSASKSLEEQQKRSASLPTTSTAGDLEGPVATGFFGWAAEATHRFMDNSHQGEARQIHGLSFRLDYRDHDSIGRNWENVTVRIAHGDWSSIDYNASEKFELLDQSITVFNKPWSFPTLKGFPPTEPAEWGGPQNALNFRFDKPFEYNGKDAIYVEFVFAGGKTVDGRPWEGDLPFGFEYYLDSMPESGGWRMAETPVGLYRSPRVEAVVSYTAGGQSVWTSAPKGMPYLKWDFKALEK